LKYIKIQSFSYSLNASMRDQVGSNVVFAMVS